MSGNILRKKKINVLLHKMNPEYLCQWKWTPFVINENSIISLYSSRPVS